MDKQQHDVFSALNDWFNQPAGVRVGQAFQGELRPYHALLNGDVILQLGVEFDVAPWCETKGSSLSYSILPCSVKSSAIRSRIQQLPIARHSIDTLYAPLSIEAASLKEGLLDEFDRVIKPMGHLVFLGVNPWSLWGAWLKCSKKTFLGINQQATLCGSLTLKRMMAYRGYRLCALKLFYHVPPVNSSQWIKRLSFLDQMGKMMGPVPAGFYCLVMQKYHYPLTGLPIKSADAFRNRDLKIPMQPAMLRKRHY